MQLPSMERDRRGDVAPQRCLIEVDERPAPLVEQPPSLHDGATLTDQAAEPQAIEGRDAVAGQEHARTRDAPRLVPLDDLARKAAQVQCARRREPRDPATHDDVTRTLPPRSAHRPPNGDAAAQGCQHRQTGGPERVSLPGDVT